MIPSKIRKQVKIKWNDGSVSVFDGTAKDTFNRMVSDSRIAEECEVKEIKEEE